MSLINSFLHLFDSNFNFTESSHANSNKILAAGNINNGLALVLIDDIKSKKPKLIDFVHFPGNNKAEISSWLLRNKLRGLSVRLLLTPSDYSWHFIDRPPEIPEEEIINTLPWLLKEQINFSAEEGLFDYCHSGNNHKIFAAVSERNKINNYTQIIEQVGLNVSSIQVSIVSLANLVHLSYKQRGVSKYCYGFIWLFNQHCWFVIGDQDNFNLVRHVFFKKNRMLEEVLRSIDDELIRTTDYYKMHGSDNLPDEWWLMPWPSDYRGMEKLLMQGKWRKNISLWQASSYFEGNKIPDSNQNLWSAILSAGVFI